MINKVNATNLDLYTWWDRPLIQLHPRAEREKVIPTRIPPFPTRRRDRILPTKPSLLPFILAGVVLWIYLRK